MTAFADMLAAGADWLERMRTRFAAHEVSYHRGEMSVSLRATTGRTQYQTDDGLAVRIRFSERDYLIVAADLILGGLHVSPRPGDLIKDVARSKTQVYEVVDWRYSDEYMTTYRIATKYIGEE